MKLLKEEFPHEYFSLKISGEELFFKTNILTDEVEMIVTEESARRHGYNTVDEYMMSDIFLDLWNGLKRLCSE